MTIQTRRGEGVRVVRVEDELHYVAGMALEDPNAVLLLVSIPCLLRGMESRESELIHGSVQERGESECSGGKWHAAVRLTAHTPTP